jgi:hypothetical protein
MFRINNSVARALELIDLYVEYLKMYSDLFYDKSYKRGASAERDKI